MPLSESQILRYSRQILLWPIGGEGQEKLLSCGALLTGTGAAQSVAAAYLAAGGSAVQSGDRAVVAGEEGFLFGKKEIGQSSSAALKMVLMDLNPDALGSNGLGRLGGVPASFSGTAPWVALGWSGGTGEVVFRSEKGCRACFEENAGRLSGAPASANSVLLGALGALVFQRLCLGLPEDLGRLQVHRDGAISHASVLRCDRCS